MNEDLNNTGKRLLALRAKLSARQGSTEYRESNKAILAEIEKLEKRTVLPVVTPSSSQSKRKSTSDE